MPKWQRFALVVVTVAACVGCDQQTKSIATAGLRGREPYSFLADTVRFEYVENTGSFLGLGDSMPVKWRTAVFTYGCTAGIAALLIYIFLATQASAMRIVALSLMCAGGIGNLLDRWLCGGYVRDFLNVGIGPLRTGIFNVADMALMAGCVMAFFSAEDRSRRSRF